MYGDTHFITDKPDVAFDIDEHDDGSLDWDSVETVTLDDSPYEDAFDTNEFYVVDTVVTRPMEQTYVKGDTEVVLTKPREELKKAQWSLDNAPFTLTHPSKKRVQHPSQIHGFVTDVAYDDEDDKQTASTHIPVVDETAKSFIEDHGDVSPGLWNVVQRADDDDPVDGYQTDIVYDHLAAVKQGRCGTDDGCGLDVDSTHGHLDNSDVPVTELSADARDYDIAPTLTLDSGERVFFAEDYENEDGQYFAVGPDENPDDEAKYPINSCRDVQDAWFFAKRERGDISISFDTLKDRIQSKARDLGCDVPMENTPDIRTDSTDITNDNMSCSCNDSDEPEDNPMIKVTDLSVDAVAEKHDGVSELKQRAQRYEEVEAALDSSLDVDEDAAPSQVIENLVSDVSTLQDSLDEYEKKEKESTIEEITDLTSTWSEDELSEMSLDSLDEKLELAKDLAADVTDVESTTDSGEGGGDEPEYKTGQLYDLSSTA